MPKFKDITGCKINKLRIISRNNEAQAKDKYNRVFWNCECDCGNKVIFPSNNILSGHRKSCGKCSRNRFEEKADYYVGYTTKGDAFLFDKEDFDSIKKITWCKKDGYIVGYVNKKVVYLHRFILKPPKGYVIDHINHNGLDNRRNNLRVCKQKDNSKNNLVSKNNTSGETGVRYIAQSNKWSAYINIDYKQKYLGCFDTFEEAVEARLAAEKIYYKEFARKREQ